MSMNSICEGAITRKLIRECIEGPSPTIIEIGCNDGGHTQWFLEIFQNPSVYCFEPDSRAANRFRHRIGSHPNVAFFELAVSDHDGDVTFYQSSGTPARSVAEDLADGWHRSGSIRKPKEHLRAHPWVTFDHAVVVQTTTLDRWCKQHHVEEIDFLWMDVQGAEMNVFKGGANAISQTRFLYTEYNDREMYEGQSTLRQLLDHLGDFELLIRFPGDALLVNRRLVPHPNQGLQRIVTRMNRRSVPRWNILRRLRASQRYVERQLNGLLPAFARTKQQKSQ